MLCSFLPGTGTGNMIPGSGRIPGSRQTTASATKKSSWHRSGVSAKLKLSQLSSLRRRHSSLIWPFDDDGNWEEDGCLTVVTGWHLHVCPLFRTVDGYEVDCCKNARSIGKTGKTLNYGTLAQVLVCIQNGKICSMLYALLILAGNRYRLCASWRKYEIPGSRHTAESATKPLPRTRSEVSPKLKLSQLSTLRRRHSSLIWTAKRMVLSQWSLADTCICALSSVLVINMKWIAARTPHQLARLARHWTSTNACCSSTAKVVQCSALSRSNHIRQPESW